MKAIILAAGYATRLYPLTKDTPKALLPVAGRTILDRLLDGMRAIPEIDHIHLVTNHRFAPAFEEWRQTAQVHCPITVHDDGTTSNEDRLGAVGDIAFVLERAGIDDDLFVAASDNLFTFPLSDFAADFRRSKFLAQLHKDCEFSAGADRIPRKIGISLFANGYRHASARMEAT